MDKPMTGEQLDELMTVAVNMQRDSEKAGDRPSSMFAYAVQVAVLELRKVRNDVAALAAENAGLKAANTEGCKWDGEQWVGISIETPATEAILAEVRASTIDSLVENKTKQLADMHPDTHAFGATAMSIRSQINELQMFATEIRKGEAS